MSLIIATGAHSGLGLAALRHLLLTAPQSLPPPYKFLLLTRPSASSSGIDSLSSLLASHPSSSLSCTPLDLGDLPSVRAAAPNVAAQVETLQRESEGGIQRIVLFLNAAVWPASQEFTPDPQGGEDALHAPEGVEKSCAVNYLSHLLLLQPLLPLLLAAPHARVVFTSSALHRRAEPANLASLFSAPSPSQGRDLYVHSKFLQALSIRRLHRLLSSHPSSLQLLAVQPGFVPSTGLGRQAGPLARAGMYALSCLPLSFVESEEGAARTLCDALARPLGSFEHEASDAAVARDEGQQAQAGVSETWLVRGAKVGRPDERTEEMALQDKWWPAGFEL